MKLGEAVERLTSEGEDRLLTISEAARLLGLSVSGMEKATYRGAIPYVKLGTARRYRLSDIRRAIREGW